MFDVSFTSGEHSEVVSNRIITVTTPTQEHSLTASSI
jgi:hypothetical protein